MTRPNFDHVTFDTAQVAYLESLFPDVVLSPNDSEAKLRHYMGQREVLRAIRIKTRGINARIITARGNIPEPG